MMQLHDGQCGLCTHFGDNHDATAPQPLTLTGKNEPVATHVSACDHPAHAPLHLQVTAVSGCQGFEPLERTQA